MFEYVFDLEADGLLDTITKIHCLSYKRVDGDKAYTIYDPDEMVRFFNPPDCSTNIYIGHHIIGYDFKALKKIYGIERPKYLVDTLGLSWYLHPDRAEHGLESYGEDYGVPKPKINDWHNLTIEEYTNRCETDVEINRRLWLDLKRKLQKIYSE